MLRSKDELLEHYIRRLAIKSTIITHLEQEVLSSHNGSLLAARPTVVRALVTPPTSKIAPVLRNGRANTVPPELMTDRAIRIPDRTGGCDTRHLNGAIPVNLKG